MHLCVIDVYVANVLAYVCWRAGDHKIDIKYLGRPITGSPFICKVCDCAQISVTNLCSITRCGKAVEFDGEIASRSNKQQIKQFEKNNNLDDSYLKDIFYISCVYVISQLRN